MQVIELMANASPSSVYTMSDSGWSNNEVFFKYLLKHAVKPPGQKLLLLFDHHKSHFYPAVREWAKNNDVVLFILLLHTSHKLQFLDVSCFGPLKAKYKKV